MTEWEHQLLSLLQARSFKRGEFRLASGVISPYYLDVRATSMCSRGAHLIGQVVYDRIKTLNPDAVGGPAAGAIPLVTATVMTACSFGQELEGFWVNNVVKGHGVQGRLSGVIVPGSKVVVLEDVTTSGQSALKAVEEVERVASVVMVLALVDRLAGASELFENRRFESVYTIRDFGDWADESAQESRT